MSFISYAQNFEDVMLWRALKHVEIGFYIDVGANDPVQDSVTKAFYDYGWRGINIEPVPQWFEKIVPERPRDINLQVAAGNQTGELVLYELPDTGLSTFDLSIAEKHEAERGYQKIERTVPVKTLTEICRDIHLSPIHFLKIDVEGAEKQVLEGVDFSIIRPWIILVESTLPNSQIEDYVRWEPILLNASYNSVYFDGLNRFYVAREHSHLKESFKTPPNYFDGFVLSGESTAPFCNLVLDQLKELADYKDQYVELNKELADYKDQYVELNKELEEYKNRFKESQSYAQDLQNELKTSRAKIDELHQTAHHWWVMADSLNKEIQGLYKSKSWRITWPLRMVMKGIRRLLSFPFHVLSWFKRSFKRIVKYLLRLVMSYVLPRPELKAKCLTFLANRPSLKARLRLFASNNGLNVHFSGLPNENSSIPVRSELSGTTLDRVQLTPRARRIYDDLTDAIEQREDN